MKSPELDKERRVDHSTRAPLISVLMPCYNAQETIDEAIKSIVSQTFALWELVIVDDGSTDGSCDRVTAWAARDARIRLIRQDHAGIVTALNTGWRACLSPLIARMDADDRSHPERFAKQAARMDADPDLAVVSCMVEAFPVDQVREGFRLYLEWLNGLVSADDIRREMFVEAPVAHPSTIIRNSWLDRLGGYEDHGWPEDYDLWLRLHLAGARFVKVPQALFSWREHPVRLTRTDSRYSVENFLRAKSHYLVRGPLRDRRSVIVWGAGQMGRRLSKHLVREGAPLVGFIDVDPKKIGRQQRGLPVIAPAGLSRLWKSVDRPILLAAVGARGARKLIRQQLTGMGLREGQDWLAVA
ncbi:MAG TPA: glycosyltransferase [Anaerolineales bacterium]|nr:glycosyltransferase [Anaerolineales bacterium]